MKTLYIGDKSCLDKFQRTLTSPYIYCREWYESGKDMINHGIEFTTSMHEIAYCNDEMFFNGIRLAIKRGIIQSDNIQIKFFSGGEIHNIIIMPSGSLMTWPKGFFEEYDEFLTEILS